MKEMTSVASTMMSEEDKVEMEKEMNGGASPVSGNDSTPSTVQAEIQTPTSSTPAEPQPTSPSNHSSPPILPPGPGNPSPHAEATSTNSVTTTSGDTKDASSSSKPGSPKDKDPKKRAKMTPEQRAKLQELDNERRKAMEARITELTKKLIERLRPFVEANRPGDKDDSETIAFEARMKREADDLKLESFGVEVYILCLRCSCHF